MSFMKNAYLESAPTIDIKNPSKWTLHIHSKAGERTGILIKNLSVVLDAGLPTSKIVKAVFLTHKHCDHSLSLPMLIKSRDGKCKGQEKLMGRPVYCPPDMKRIIIQHERLILMMCDDDYDSDIPEKKYDGEIDSDNELCARQMIHPFEVKYGDVVDSVPGVPNLGFEVFAVYHTCKANGYGFFTTKKVLKEEYRHFLKDKETKKELGKLAKSGVDINETVKVYELAFYCDSSSKNLSSHDEWKKYPVVICECTEANPDFPDDDYESRGHTHINNLIPIFKEHLGKQFILIHTSLKYNEDDLQKFQDKINSEHKLNILMWKN